MHRRLCKHATKVQESITQAVLEGVEVEGESTSGSRPRAQPISSKLFRCFRSFACSVKHSTD